MRKFDDKKKTSFNGGRNYEDRGKHYGNNKNGERRSDGKRFDSNNKPKRFNDRDGKESFGGRANRDKFENRDARENRDVKEVRENEEISENILEGRNPIREAIKAGRSIEKLLVAEGEIQGTVKEIVYTAKENGAIIQEVERARLDRISVTGAHQGLIAYVAVKEYVSVEDILGYAKERGEDPFIVVLDGICDPQNLGAIIRSAECAGVHGVIIPERRAVGLTPVVAKCSAGAIEYMRIARVTNISQTVEKLKKAGVWVYGASMEGKNYSRVNMTGPCAIVIGAEGEGLSTLVKRNCDCLVSLPQLGKIDSLNASVAAGILMYDCLRQKGDKN